MLDPEKTRLPVLAQVSGNDPEGIALVAQAVCRGQGKTEGYHDRRIPLGHALKNQDLANVAKRRVDALGELRLALRLALFVFAQGGPEKVAGDKDTTRKFVEPYLERFERGADAGFFPDLLEELNAPETEREDIHKNWLKDQLTFAQRVLAELLPIAPPSRQPEIPGKIAGRNCALGKTGENSSF